MPHYDPVTGIDRLQPAGSEPDPIPGYPDYAVGAEGDDRAYSRARKGTTALGGWLALLSGRTLGHDEKFYVRRGEGQPLRLGLTVTQARALVAAAKNPEPAAPPAPPEAPHYVVKFGVDPVPRTLDEALTVAREKALQYPGSTIRVVRLCADVSDAGTSCSYAEGGA